ncbi:MAG: aminomethyl-transferring glycine dehydrogenase subunit GcvPB [Clostridia bacterium]|nr:aminomethyl-transferring glycine dehydrogenase subunit GcvPB [Clostridia bacterium]
MKLLFERSREGHSAQHLPQTQLSGYSLPEQLRRCRELRLPALAETEISRHYTELSQQVHGVNSGFYPLGSCTMKYNPKIDEQIASLPGFTGIHPLQPVSTAQGCLEVLDRAGQALCEITGMDAMSFQPAAGAHGEFTGLLLIKAYHQARGEGEQRTKVIVPDSAHGTNPATATMCGYTIVNIASNAAGGVDLDALRRAVGADTAALMLTNPNTVGIFDPNILEITRIVHEAGGQCYYDGANMNAIMGLARPGDMGFDVVHLNIHKTFATPHGGGGPGSGPCGCKAHLAPFLPADQVTEAADGYRLERPAQSIGRVKAFFGNFLVVVKALTYIISLGAEGIVEAAETAVLNANYMKKRLSPYYHMAYDDFCMHEFVLSLAGEKSRFDVSALDVAKALMDHGMHPPTMYFPLIVPEALMIEPTETESKDTLDEAIEAFIAVQRQLQADAASLRQAPQATPVRRLDETQAARRPVLTYQEKEL